MTNCRASDKRHPVTSACDAAKDQIGESPEEAKGHDQPEEEAQLYRTLAKEALTEPSNQREEEIAGRAAQIEDSPLRIGKRDPLDKACGSEHAGMAAGKIKAETVANTFMRKIGKDESERGDRYDREGVVGSRQKFRVIGVGHERADSSLCPKGKPE